MSRVSEKKKTVKNSVVITISNQKGGVGYGKLNIM